MQLIQFCASPWLSANVICGLVLKFALIAPEIQYQRLPRHEAIKVLIKKACFRLGKQECQLLDTQFIKEMEHFVKGKIQKDHSYYYCSQVKRSRERTELLLKLLADFKKSG